METEIITLISNVGFPIVTAWYVLLRLENTLKENTKAITSLSDMLKSRR